MIPAIYSLLILIYQDISDISVFMMATNQSCLAASLLYLYWAQNLLPNELTLVNIFLPYMCLYCIKGCNILFCVLLYVPCDDEEVSRGDVYLSKVRREDLPYQLHHLPPKVLLCSQRVATASSRRGRCGEPWCRGYPRTTR